MPIKIIFLLTYLEDFNKINRITSIGSETSGGSVYVLNLDEPLEYNLSLPLTRRLYEITSFDCTVWTADCNSDGIHAVIGEFFTFALFEQVFFCFSKTF